MENNLGNLNAVEVCELGLIKVNALKYRSIFDCGRECIQLANLLKVVVQLHFSDKVIDVYVTTKLEDILKQMPPDKN